MGIEARFDKVLNFVNYRLKFRSVELYYMTNL
jgi:hypothetical protein